MDPAPDKPVTQIDIVVPVYREEAVLARFDESLRAVLESAARGRRFHIIYVLDRSPDRSFDVLKSLVGRTRDGDGSIAATVLHMSRRFGHQMSLVAGMDHARGDAVVMMDSDLQHPPELLPRMFDLFDQGYEIVQTIRQYDQTTPFSKRMTSHMFYALQRTFSPVQMDDGAADFRLVSRKVADVFRHSIREHNQFLRGLFRWVGFRTAHVHFVSPPRPLGQTKYTVSRLLGFFGDGIVSFSRVPLRMATLLGFIMSGFAVGYGFYLLGEYSFYGNLPRGYTSLILVALLIGGLQLLVLGVIGEYIGHIFDEVKGRPLYIVDEVVTNCP